MYSTVLAGGEVVTSTGSERVDVGIVGERIAALTAPGSLTDAAERVVDVSGLIVVPGGIDPHVHCGGIPGPKRAVSPSAPPSVVSRAALFGGTTTIIDFAWHEAGERLTETVGRVRAAWAGMCYSDYGLHGRLRGVLEPSLLADIADVIAEGVPSFKIFMSDIRPTLPAGMVPLGSIERLFQATAGRGAVTVHAEDDELVKHGYERYFAAGTDLSYRNFSRIHSALSEEISTRRIVRLARSVEGAALYVVHVGAAGALDALAEARALGQAVYGETIHVFALRNETDYEEPDGVKYHNFPSLKTAVDNEAIWNGIANGSLSTLATDALIVPYAQKIAGTTIDHAVGGHCGVEPRMAIAYTEIVTKRRLGLRKFVDITSTNAAKILGLYPRKGVIAVGSDADLAVLDPSGGRTITVSALHESDWTPWEGWAVSAWPVLTLLRGRLVVERGAFSGELSYGQFLPRKLEGAVFNGSAA